jgi:uncharacterized protein YggE
MATITVRGRGVTTVAPDEVTVGLSVDVTFQQEQG